jgi:hypothetical protein
MIIKRVDPASCAKIAGTLYAIIGLIIGAIVSLVAMAGGFGAEAPQDSGIAAMIGVGSIIMFPIFYGVIAFAAALIGAWLYNILAGMVGGIRIDVQ